MTRLDAFDVATASTQMTEAIATDMKHLKSIRITEDGHIEGRLVDQLRRPKARVMIDGEEALTVRGRLPVDPDDENSAAAGMFSAPIPLKYRDDALHSYSVLTDRGDTLGEGQLRIPRAASGKITACDPTGALQGVIQVTGLRAESLTARLVINGAHEVPFILGPKELTRDTEDGVTKFAVRLRLPSVCRTGAPAAIALILDEADGPLVLDEKVFPTTPPPSGRPYWRSPAKRMVIVETSLTEPRGHMMACIDVCIAAARNNGLDPIVIGNRKFSGQDISGAPVHGAFSKSLYDIASLPTIGRQLAKLETFKAAFKTELDAVFDTYQSENTLFFYPTVNEYLIGAIADAMRDRVFSYGEQHLICLMLETGILRRETGDAVLLDPVKVELFRDAFATLGGDDVDDPATRLDKHVHLAAISETHAINYQALSAGPIGRMPPMYGYARRFETITHDRSVDGDDRQVLLYLGEAKEDKGFLLAPTVARKLLAADPGLKLVVQVHNPKSAAEEAAADQLRSLAGPRVRVVDGFLDRAVYMGLLESSDAVVMAYSAERYAGKTSGVLWEAMSFDAPVIVPALTWLQQEAALSGVSHEAFPAHTAEEVSNAILRLLAKTPHKTLKAPKTDMFEDVHGYFNAFLSTTAADAPTFAELFDPQATQPRERDVADMGWLTGVGAVSADDKTAFTHGWGAPFQTDYHRVGRWMGQSGVIRVDADRANAIEIVIAGETLGVTEPEQDLKLCIDGRVIDDVKVEVRNARDFRIRAIAPARAADAPAAPTWVEITAVAPETDQEFNIDEILLVNALTYAPFPAQDDRSQ